MVEAGSSDFKYEVLSRSSSRQALKIEEPGCLKDYIFQHCFEFDRKWHQTCYGEEKMS